MWTAPAERHVRVRRTIDDEAMPVVLGLLDQVYGMRTRLRHLVDAVAAQPEEVRLAVAAELKRQIMRDDEDRL